MNAPRPNHRVGRFVQLPADEAKALLEAMDSMSVNDARDQINLAAWMERRLDAIGPYGPHILDGVQRYEARIAHHDDVVRELLTALAQAAVPLEGLTLAAHATGSNMGLCKGTWDEINNGVAHIRAALAKIAQEG